MEYISREAAIAAATKDISPQRTQEFNAGCARAANNIKCIPAANVTEQKEGKWITDKLYLGDDYETTILCPFCGKEYSRDMVATLQDSDDVFNFCPNCGADMRKRSEQA